MLGYALPLCASGNYALHVTAGFLVHSFPRQNEALLLGLRLWRSFSAELPYPYMLGIVSVRLMLSFGEAYLHVFGR
jgi:hypothetical protein